MPIQSKFDVHPWRSEESATLSTPSTFSVLSVPRRDFLRALTLGGLALGFSPARHSLLRADDKESLPAGKHLIVRSAKPLNAEPTLDDLVADWITPVERFYVRNHGPIASVDTDAFRLSVEGLVAKPLQLSLSELVERFPSTKATVTLTCAGNRRNEFHGPKIPGVAWGAGAIGNATWSGISLAALLRHAGIRDGAKHVWFEGADEIVDKTEKYPFGGSVPLDKALAGNDRTPGALLATKMNDKPLTAEHGFPLRAVVPGYIGARSVKWLKKIVVSDRPSPNHYLAQAYKLITEETPAAVAAAAPLYEYALNSVIAVPAPAATVASGKLKIQGFALPGGATGSMLKTIEISTDGGQSWTAAKITSPVKDFCWVLWSAENNVTPKTDRLLVRATDSAGQSQPREMAWNAKGYQYNAWHQVPVSVK
ncbi:MAG: molybdopterin-dependent oxidoreductase [Deltaproteobacteria bacterium]